MPAADKQRKILLVQRQISCGFSIKPRGWGVKSFTKIGQLEKCYINVFDLISSSEAFPFLFATNLFPQYQLNCFLSVQKHRSAEGILDIGEERETAKHNISKNVRTNIYFFLKIIRKHV